MENATISIYTRSKLLVFFERSEFLIDTSPKKIRPSAVCPCVRVFD